MKLAQKTLVLIVDDEAAHRLMTRRALARALPDFEAIEADSIASASAAAEARLNQISLAVIDFNLGDECGVGVLTFLRRHRTYAQLPCIMVSTSTLEKDILRTYAEGANCCITKASDPRDYQANLGRAVRFLLSAISH
jgi:DNA-binding response OmpR family regulator